MLIRVLFSSLICIVSGENFSSNHLFGSLENSTLHLRQEKALSQARFQGKFFEVCNINYKNLNNLPPIYFFQANLSSLKAEKHGIPFNIRGTIDLLVLLKYFFLGIEIGILELSVNNVNVRVMGAQQSVTKPGVLMENVTLRHI